MTDDQQTVVPCGRTHDHEDHDWYSDPTKHCPGVIVPPLAGAQPPEFAQCGSTYKGDHCVRPVGHEEQGLMHVGEGTSWPAHVPAPGGSFDQEAKEADVHLHYGKQVAMVAEARNFRTEIAGVVIAPCDEYGRTEEEKRLRAMLRAAGVAEHFIDGTQESVDRDDQDQCDQIGCNQTSGHGGKHGAVV